MSTPIPAPNPGTEQPKNLQFVREGLAALISVVILALTAYMMLATFAGASQAQKENYDRQKDIMLYGLALLGTVTGYYLGRVPAELHAQQAQRAADTANTELRDTQSRLTDNATTAARVAGQLGQAESEKAKAIGQARDAKETLAAVNDTISQALDNADEERSTLAAGATVAYDVSPELRRAQHQIEKLLARMDV